ncbi:flagellar protein FlbB, partial [Treponema pallidum subsp. pallidum]
KTDDQDVIEVFRMVDAAARQRGVNSLVPYWLSLMPPDRAAEIQRKMANKPADFP